MPPSVGVGDKSPFDYSLYDIIATVNSVDGSIEISKSLNKYDKVDVDILNPTLSNVGYPHWVIEDSLEWVNSGSPSHLSQVFNANIISSGIAAEKISPGLQDSSAPLYQSKIYIPNNQDWYDKLNSTIDYQIISNSESVDIHIPYVNAAIYIEELKEIWVGGLGGILRIDKDSKSINSLNINADNIFIKDIKKYNNSIYILTDNKLYTYDIASSLLSVEKGLGLSQKLNKIIYLRGSNLCVASDDGIYTKKMKNDNWVKVLESSKINVLSVPDSAFAINDEGVCYSSNDGFNWKRIGIFNKNIVNKIEKHRSQILIGTNSGLYQDNGTFYTNNLSIRLLDISNDITKSSLVVVNDIVSNFDKAIIGLSDGSWFLYQDSFIKQPESKLKCIHKILIVESDVWLFGFDNFRVSSESFIRKLATGSKL